MNTFNNFIPNKISKFDYKKPVWMNKEIISYLKKRSKLAKKYYNKPTRHKKDLQVNATTESSRLIIANKEKKLVHSSSVLNLRILTQPLKPTSLV